MDRKCLTIKGLKGTWYILDEGHIADKNGKVKKVYLIESEQWGEMAQTFMSRKKWIKQIDELEDLEEVARVMKYDEWQD